MVPQFYRPIFEAIMPNYYGTLQAILIHILLKD